MLVVCQQFNLKNICIIINMAPRERSKIFSRKKYFRSLFAIYVRVHARGVRGLLLIIF
jgi:hypothetical protein